MNSDKALSMFKFLGLETDVVRLWKLDYMSPEGFKLNLRQDYIGAEDLEGDLHFFPAKYLTYECLDENGEIIPDEGKVALIEMSHSDRALTIKKYEDEITLFNIIIENDMKLSREQQSAEALKIAGTVPLINKWGTEPEFNKKNMEWAAKLAQAYLMTQEHLDKGYKKSELRKWLN